MGPRLVILGHHYQQDGVIAHADLQGDSYQLSKSAAERQACEAIAFCGVHFMAETADILVNRPEKVAARGGRRVTVVLPDMAAGCSMADMAAIEQVEDAWADLGSVIDTADITPVTYSTGPSRRPNGCSSSPTSTSVGIPRGKWGSRSTRCASGIRTSPRSAATMPGSSRRAA
jgi:hypothetical protein